jgi:hypothetical protein
MNIDIKNGRRWGWAAVIVICVAGLAACEKVKETPTEPIPDIPVPTNLSAIISRDGVTLSWEYDSKYDYKGFDVFRSQDDQVTWYKQATVTEPPFVDSNLRTGYAYWYAVAGVSQDDIRGKRSAPLPAFPAVYEVLIEDGAAVINQRDVLLQFTAPLGTQNVRFSEDSLLTGAQWRDFASSYVYTLSAGDGKKTVFAQFLDAAGNLTSPVKSSIDLDTFAQIDSLVYSLEIPPALDDTTIAPGGTVHFRVVTAGYETGGFVAVYIEGIGSTPVEIYDDGNNGDRYPNDGIYERDHTFMLSFRQRSMRMSAEFIDAATNVSVEREFARNLYMSDPPDAITLLSITEITSDSMTLRWTRSLDDHFGNYSIYRDDNSDVQPETAVLAGTVANQSTTVFTDSGLSPSTEYFYKVYVVNDLDEGTESTNWLSDTTAP